MQGYLQFKIPQLFVCLFFFFFFIIFISNWPQGEGGIEI